MKTSVIQYRAEVGYQLSFHHQRKHLNIFYVLCFFIITYKKELTWIELKAICTAFSVVHIDTFILWVAANLTPKNLGEMLIDFLYLWLTIKEAAKGIITNSAAPFNSNSKKLFSTFHLIVWLLH